MSGVPAAIEIGSGALKVAIAGPERIRQRFATDLMRHLDSAGRLSDAGRAAFEAALVDAATLLEAHGVERPRVVATAALRETSSPEVADLVRRHLHTEIEVLDGATEADLGYRAAVAGRDGSVIGPEDPDRPDLDGVITLDIGFGSTELATRLEDGTVVSMSLPLGAITVTDAYLHSDPPRADELSAALSVIELHLDDVVRERPDLAEALAAAAAGRAEVVGLGAVRYMAEVELGRNEGDEIHDYWLAGEAAEEVFRALATEPRTDRAHNPGLRPEHLDWIVGALCILVEFLRQFALPGARVSTRGVIDALVDP